MRDSVTFMEILEEGIAEGTAKGITQGIAQGRITGEQEMLLALAQRRLGASAPETLARIQAIQSPDRLIELAERLLSVETRDEFLADLA